jgi:hypothetical protein
MSHPTFAFITPSYAPDFQRCKLLCWSIKQFVTQPVKHYIVVDRRDLALFQQLADEHTIILAKEDILPRWIKRLPFVGKKNIWLNVKGYRSGNWLLRGWLIQQIVKLSAAKYSTEDVLVFVDSDVAFIDAFDPQTLVNPSGQVRLFRVPHPDDPEEEFGRRWKRIANQLLSLPIDNQYEDFYVSQIVTWRRDKLMHLYQQVEQTYPEGWIEAIAQVNDLSEYVLYGVFATYVLGERSGHYDDYHQKICWCHWEETPMSQEELRGFFAAAQASGHKAVMISAKSSVDLSIAQFQKYLAQQQLV